MPFSDIHADLTSDLQANVQTSAIEPAFASISAPSKRRKLAQDDPNKPVSSLQRDFPLSIAPAADLYSLPSTEPALPRLFKPRTGAEMFTIPHLHGTPHLSALFIDPIMLTHDVCNQEERDPVMSMGFNLCARGLAASGPTATQEPLKRLAESIVSASSVTVMQGDGTLLQQQEQEQEQQQQQQARAHVLNMKATANARRGRVQAVLLRAQALVESVAAEVAAGGSPAAAAAVLAATLGPDGCLRLPPVPECSAALLPAGPAFGRAPGLSDRKTEAGEPSRFAQVCTGSCQL